MKKIIKEHEFYKNGKLIEKIKGDEAAYEYLDKLKESYCKVGYRIIRDGYGEQVFYSERIHKAFVIYKRTYIGFKDCNGKKIYEDNILKNNRGELVSINEKWDKDGEFYYRIEYCSDRWCDEDIENLNFIKEEGVHIV